LNRQLRRADDWRAALQPELADWLFRRRVVSTMLKREHVLCIGDSHVQVFHHVSMPGVWFRVKSIEGATASGLPNPKSKTGAQQAFARALGRARPWQQVLVQLGEVDCGFVIWYRAARHGLSVEEQFAQTVGSYEAFIARIAGMGLRRTIVLSVPLPTISDDGVKWGKVARLRESVTASQAERTRLTTRFNAELSERCQALGVAFVDATSGHTDCATGLVASRFVRESDDHHLADEPYAELISSRLAALWDGEPRGEPDD
jgi:hypothetical protein